MFEIKVTVDIPALDRLIPVVDAYLAGRKRLGVTDTFADGDPLMAPYTAPDMPVADPNTVQPTVTTPVVTPAPVPDYNQPTPTTAPTPVVPPVAAPTAAPAYTLAQVAKAGAELLTGKPALIPQLQELLKKYGAQTAQELPLDRLGEFAAELRAMGARI